MPNNKWEVTANLQKLGVSYADAEQLRKIAMTLSAWHELECGTDRGCIERDEKTQVPYLTYDIGRNGERRRVKIPDKETGALRRLTAIMERYPDLAQYVQGDPRGASLYIVRGVDIPEGARIEEMYTRGVAVYK